MLRGEDADGEEQMRAGAGGVSPKVEDVFQSLLAQAVMVEGFVT